MCWLPEAHSLLSNGAPLAAVRLAGVHFFAPLSPQSRPAGTQSLPHTHLRLQAAHKAKRQSKTPKKNANKTRANCRQTKQQQQQQPHGSETLESSPNTENKLGPHSTHCRPPNESHSLAGRRSSRLSWGYFGRATLDTVAGELRKHAAHTATRRRHSQATHAPLSLWTSLDLSSLLGSLSSACCLP